MLVCGKERTNNKCHERSKCDSLTAYEGKIYLQIFLHASVGIIYTNVMHPYSKQPLRPLNIKSKHHDTRIPGLMEGQTQR